MSAQKEQGGLYEMSEKGERVLKHQTQPRPPREPDEPTPKPPKAKGRQPAVDGPTTTANGVETL